MRCALVFYFVVTIFVVVYSLPELCVFNYYGRIGASCGRDDVDYIFDFIPPVSQNISFITMQRQPLKQLPYNAFRNLSSQSSISVIWLQHCQISYVDAGALLNLHNLTTIYLSHNDIKQIDSKLFSDTRQIELIAMGYNKIEVLPNGLFQNLTLLKVVYLEHNRIRQVQGFSFKNTPSLLVIVLDNNQIEFINMLFKDKFDNLTNLSLNGNPWKCNCELGPLYEFLIKINQLSQYGLVCENPPILQGRKLNDISRDRLICRSEDATSTQNSVTTGIEPVDTGILQPISNQNWIQYAILVLELVCVATVITGVVYVVRYTLAKSHFRLPTIVKRRSDRTNARNMERGIPVNVVQSSAVSENNDSATNIAGVDEEIRKATTN